jgi:hypothetical protein
MSRKIILILAIVVIAAIETTICLYRSTFLCLEKNTIFLYTWDFLHEHIAIPAWEEWKWTGIFQTGGFARYIDKFFAQFYCCTWAVEAVQIPLAMLWIFLWCKILGVPRLRRVGLSLVSFCSTAQIPCRKKDVGSIPNAAAPNTTGITSPPSVRTSPARAAYAAAPNTTTITSPLSVRTSPARAAYVAAVIITATAAWLYLTISPAFPLGTTSGILINAIALLGFTKDKHREPISTIICFLLLFYLTGIPATIIYFAGITAITIKQIICNKKHNAPNNIKTIILLITLTSSATIPYFTANKLFYTTPTNIYNKQFFTEFKQKSTDKLYHSNRKIEYALYENEYEKALQLCNKSLPKQDIKHIQSALELAHYTKTALLFNGELCDKFLQYYNAFAMQWIFPIMFSDKAIEDLFFRLGELGCAKHAAINEMEKQGLSTYTAKILNSKATEKGLQIPTDATSPPDIIILQLPQDQSPAVRDAKAMIYLLFKQIDSAVAQFNDALYIPQYIQEALLIMYGYGQNPAVMQELQKYAIANETIRKHEQFLQALQAYQYRQATRQQIAQRFTGTYAYYYYFQTSEYQQ